jgi:hypothetical protein
MNQLDLPQFTLMIQAWRSSNIRAKVILLEYELRVEAIEGSTYKLLYLNGDGAFISSFHRFRLPITGFFSLQWLT